MTTRPHGDRLKWWAGNSCQFRNPLPPSASRRSPSSVLIPSDLRFSDLNRTHLATVQKMVGCKVSRQRATTEPLHQIRRKKQKKEKRKAKNLIRKHTGPCQVRTDVGA